MSAGATSSPRSAASWRSRSSWAGVEVRRRVDDHLHQQVAATAALHVGHAPAAQAEHPPGLGAPGHDEVLGAVERRVGQDGAEGGLGDRDVQLVDQVVALALEALVGLDPHVDVEVAVAAAAGPDRAEAAEPQGRAGVDPGRDVDGVGLLLDPPALAPAVGARLARSIWPWPPQRVHGRR